MQEVIHPMIGSFELYEVLLLVLLLVGAGPITLQYREYRNRLFYSAYIMFLIGTVATVLEHVMFPTVFQVVEHVVGIMLSGFLFWVTAMYSAEDVIDEHLREDWREVLSV